MGKLWKLPLDVKEFEAISLRIKNILSISSIMIIILTIPFVIIIIIIIIIIVIIIISQTL